METIFRLTTLCHKFIKRERVQTNITYVKDSEQSSKIIGMTDDGRIVVKIPNGRATYSIQALVSKIEE